MALRLVAPRDTTARDLQLAVVALAGGLLLLALRAYTSEHAGNQPRAYFLPPLLLMCVGLALRRMAPLTGLALGLVALAADLALGGSLGTILVFTQLLYEVCVHGPPWLWRWALGVPAGLTVVAAAAAVVVLSPSNGAVVGVFGGLVFILPVLSAITVRQYRDQAAAERVRAEQTARLAELDRRQAVVAERTSMARELHDVIANHLSAVAIHSTALLSIRDLDPAAAEKAVRVIRDNSVQGLAEMRQMVELLRDADGADPGQDAPAPGGRLAEVDRLVAQARAAGLAAGLTVTGEPRPLPISVDLAAYRIVQESLTNALKHGDGKVEVTVGYAPDRVTVTVDNPVRLAGHRPLVPGAGAGLIGMRERADLVGGRLTAGPGGTGWCVHAELPAGAL